MFFTSAYGWVLFNELDCLHTMEVEARVDDTGASFTWAYVSLMLSAVLIPDANVLIFKMRKKMIT